MKPSKELTMIGQGLVIGALYALGIFIFCAFCTVIIYFYIRHVDLQLLWGFLGATGLAVITLALSRKYFGKLSFIRQTKTKLKI
jgi:hypothetical protein